MHTFPDADENDEGQEMLRDLMALATPYSDRRNGRFVL
jgi:hypothetical protein